MTYMEPIIALAVFTILSIPLVIVFGIHYLRAKMRENAYNEMAEGNTKQPNIFIERYKNFKEKTCALIEYK